MAISKIVTNSVDSGVTITSPVINTITSAAATALTLQSAGTTAITVDTSQNVGIGTTSPGTKLQAIGIVKSGGTGTNGEFNLARTSDGLSVGKISLTESTQILDYNNLLGSGVHTFTINSAERMRIDSSGNVGIGTTTLSSGVRLYASNATNGAPATSGTTQSTGALRIRSGNNAICDFGVNGTTTWIQAADQTGLNANYDIAMQPNGGNLLVGTMTTPAQNVKGIIIAVSGSGQSYQRLSHGTMTTTAEYFYFYNGNGLVGSISSNGSTTSYTTSSDYRLKNTIAPMTGALDKVALLKPVTYKWNADGSDGQGFIAHELQEVVEGCVTGEKDATREEEYEVSPAVPAVLDSDGVETTPAVQAVKGTRTVPSYQGVDTSFLVATLTSAIQEQQALIIQLQADVAALKGVK